MGVRKGTDNFAKFRASAIDANLRLIGHELDKQRKRRTPYPDLRSLVADLSEKTGLHRTTLTRKGSKYLRTLLSYLAQQPGGARVHDSDATPDVLREKLYDARLEIRTLKDRLAIAEKRYEAGLLGPPQQRAREDLQPAAPNWYLAFADTAMVLKLVIERMNSIDEILRVDLDAKQLLDLSASVNERVVAGPDRAKWFAAYYQTLSEQARGQGGGQ